MALKPRRWPGLSVAAIGTHPVPSWGRGREVGALDELRGGKAGSFGSAVPSSGKLSHGAASFELLTLLRVN